MQERTHTKRGGAEWGLCNPLAVAAERIRACCTWLMEQLFLHQVVKTHQWWVTRNSSLIFLTTHVDQWICKKNHDSCLHYFTGSGAAENNFIPSLGKRISEYYQGLLSFIFWAGELHRGCPFSPEESECSMLSMPSASTHLGPGELGNGTGAVPYPACPGKLHTRRLCCFPLD